MILHILEIIVPVFSVIGVGWFYGRWRAPNVRDINAINITIFTPALIFYALTERASPQLGLGKAVIAGIVVVFGAALIGWVWVRLTKRRTAVYLPPIMFPNAGNIGLPVAALAFGDNGLALMVILLVIENTLQFTVGLWLLGERISPAQLVKNPMILATAAGLICMFGGWRAPTMIEPGVRMLANVSIPLMLIALGIRLSSGTAGQWQAGLAGGLASPIAGLLAAAAVVWVLKPDHTLAGIIILFGVMPPAVLNYMLAEWYDVEPRHVAAIVAMGHLIALVTIPLTLAYVL